MCAFLVSNAEAAQIKQKLRQPTHKMLSQNNLFNLKYSWYNLKILIINTLGSTEKVQNVQLVKKQKYISFPKSILLKFCFFFETLK